MKKLMLFLLALMPVLLFTACSSDDEDNTPAMSFDENTIKGTWEIKERSGETTKWRWMQAGEKLRFYSNGTCTTGFSMEDSYKIENGKVKTFYKASGEPMFVYTLISKDGEIYMVKVNGTLDESDISIMIKMVKQSQ